MSWLSQVSESGGGPLCITIVGEAGVGKTTLAAMFPDPIFIRAESGTKGVKVAEFPVVQKVEDVISQIKELGESDHSYKTLVIDSITRLYVMVESEVLAEDGKAKSLVTAHGGFQAGFKVAAERMKQVKDWCDWLLQTKGMHVVFLAHAATERVDIPDQPDYSRLSLKMHKYSTTHFTDDVDVTCFVRIPVYTTTDDHGKTTATSTGDRVLQCYATASCVSKNRLGISQDIPFKLGEFPLANYLEG